MCGDPKKAGRLLALATKLCPKIAMAYLTLGNAYVKNGQETQAIGLFEKGLCLEPKNHKLASNLAALRMKRGEVRRAFEVLKGAESEEQTSDDYWFNLGFGAEKCAMLDEAMRAYEKALTFNPGHQGALQGLAGVCISAQKYERARSCYQALLDMEPDNGIAKYFFGILQGDMPERAPSNYIEMLFDQYAENYEQDLQIKLKSQSPGAVVDAVLKMAGGRKEIKVLDLGCGTGLVGAMLAPALPQLRLTGIDLSLNMLQHAKERKLYEDLVHEDIGDYLIKENSDWDYIVASDTLIYFGDLSHLFEQASRLLKDNGYLIFTIELAQGNGVEVQANGRFRHPQPYLSKLLTEAGFTVLMQPLNIRLENASPVPGLLVVAQRGSNRDR